MMVGAESCQDVDIGTSRGFIVIERDLLGKFGGGEVFPAAKVAESCGSDA